MNLSKEQIYDFIKRPADEGLEITPETQYYIYHYFGKNRGKSWFLSWNWSAFFLGSIWFAYRKMYLYAFISFFIPFANILAALFANSLYLRFIKQKLKKGISSKGVHKPLAGLLITVYLAYALFLGTLAILGFTKTLEQTKISVQQTDNSSYKVDLQLPLEEKTEDIYDEEDSFSNDPYFQEQDYRSDSDFSFEDEFTEDVFSQTREIRQDPI